MDYLIFDLAEVDDGISSLEALASTAADQHSAVMAEVQCVLDWAWEQFPHTHGPVDDGHDWDHDLQVSVEAGGWHTVMLTLTGTGRFVEPLSPASVWAKIDHEAVDPPADDRRLTCH